MPAVSAEKLCIHLQNHGNKPWIKEFAQYLGTTANIELSMYTGLITTAFIAGVFVPVGGWIAFGAVITAAM